MTLGAPTEQTSDAPSLSFVGVVDGTYQLTSTRKDSAGGQIGDAVVQVLTIKDSALTIEQLVDGVSAVTLDLVQVPDAAPVA